MNDNTAMVTRPAPILFCSLLIAARRDAGLTQIELANRIGKPQSFVSKYESGERRLDVVEFIDVCSALKTSPIDIIKKLWEDSEYKR